MEKESSTIQNDSAATHMIKSVYLKDLSFESPNTPEIFAGNGLQDTRHQMQINILTSHIEMENNEYEVSIRLTLHSIDKDEKTICLAEVAQAGIFIIEGASDEYLQELLKVHCPRAIYPFARQAICIITNLAGFPPLLLQDFDFEAINQIKPD